MSTRLRTALLGTAIAVLANLSASSSAAPIAIVNPDFEADAAADPDGSAPLPVAGWAAVGEGFGNRLIESYDPGALGGAFGGENNFLRIRADNNAGGPLGGVSFAGGGQTVPATILANTRYTLSLDVARDSRSPFPAIIPTNDVYLGFGGGPTVLARLVNVAGASVGFGETAGVSLVSTSPVPASGGSAIWTRVYDTNAAPANLGGALFLQLFNQSDASGGLREVLFDNITLDVSQIPEPSGVTLLGLAGMALGWARRRSATV